MAFLGKRKNARGDTIWVIHYRLGKKQKMKTIGKTDKRTAQQALLRFENNLANEEFSILERKKMSLEEFICEYLQFAEVNKSESTYRREKGILVDFKHHFNAKLVNNISIKEIEEYRMLRLSDVSPVTVNLEFRHLKAVFNRAIDFGYIVQNPFAKVKPLSIPENDLPRFFELDEIQKIMDHFKNDPFRDLVNFYLYTGARLGEPLSLTWDDIDFRRQMLTIRSVHTKGKKNRIISFREDGQLKSLLLALPKRSDKLLFGPDKNEQWSTWWVSRKISLQLTKIGYQWASCHTFRHTFISHLVMHGVPLLTVKELVGHSDIKTTLKYAHLAPEHSAIMLGKRPY